MSPIIVMLQFGMAEWSRLVESCLLEPARPKLLVLSHCVSLLAEYQVAPRAELFGHIDCA
jgi:hypothetical protein